MIFFSPGKENIGTVALAHDLSNGLDLWPYRNLRRGTICPDLDLNQPGNLKVWLPSPGCRLLSGDTKSYRASWLMPLSTLTVKTAAPLSGGRVRPGPKPGSRASWGREVQDRAILRRSRSVSGGYGKFSPTSNPPGLIEGKCGYPRTVTPFAARWRPAVGLNV